MRFFQFILCLSLSSCFLIGCVDCKECMYIVEGSGGSTESSLGEYCGDEIKALEKKEYSDPAGDARVECR